jgi:hypothetical protein
LLAITTGGMGKSTLADQVYREMTSMTQFRFAKHVVFETGMADTDLHDCHEWLKNALGPVLLYLDNVQSKRQLDSLLPDELLPLNSFVLITSRMQGLVAASDHYEMPVMTHKDALALFRWHSRGQESMISFPNAELHVSVSAA